MLYLKKENPGVSAKVVTGNKTWVGDFEPLLVQEKSSFYGVGSTPVIVKCQKCDEK